MPKEMSNLKKLAKGCIRLVNDSDANPLKYWRPTPIQKLVLQDNSKLVLLRGGNQIGKTWTGVIEVHGRCTWTHPYKDTPRKPLKVWIIVHSWEQSKIIQEKFYELAPKNELHEDTEFIPGKGFRGKYPVVRYRNGSIVYFKTTGQGTLGVASGSCDYIWVDEPPPPEIYGELFARLTQTKGKMLMTLTPIGAPIDYLRTMVKDGLVSEHVGIMNVANNTPEGCRPRFTKEEIETLALGYLSIDREARMNGDWDGGVPEGRIFDAFHDDMVSDLAPNLNYYDDDGYEHEKDFLWSIGIDHGHDVASQAAILACIDMTNPQDPHVYIVDEYVSDGSNEKKHAKGILAMLHRNGLEVSDVTRWTGDRPHKGRKSGDGRMSNGLLMSGLAHEMGYPKSGLPFKIKTAYKPKWSVLYGCQVIHDRMVNGKFQIFPSCEYTIKSLKYWERKASGMLDTLSEHKHCIDAMRYGVMPIVDVKYRSAVPSKVYRRW